MSRVITIKFPTRQETMKSEIKYYSGNDVAMILTSGVRWCDRRQEFICDYCNKRCKNIGKHPIYDIFPSGSKDATTDKNILYQALKQYPEANLAIVIDGFTVIDIDGPEGLDWIRSFMLPKTRMIRTGRGHHYFFAGTPPFKTKDIDDVEIKTNGLITVPPSRHKSGKYYRRIA